jgi:tRNA pseudouridine38-40 synthase
VTRYRLDLSYDGSAYAGFAAQPGQRTVQGELERALATLLGSPARIEVAGRTDAGVHALGQVTAFDAPDDIPAEKILGGLRGLLDDDIGPLSVVAADPSFDPRRDALAREYRYVIATTPAPLVRGVVWVHRKGLDVDAMRDAAGRLAGTHTFTSFCLAGAPQPHERHLMRLEVVESRLGGAPVVGVQAIANAFMHGMVRALVGTLAEVGRGRRAPTWVDDVLEAKDRSAAGPAAPARGLILWQVFYRREDLDAALSE